MATLPKLWHFAGSVQIVQVDGGYVAVIESEIPRMQQGKPIPHENDREKLYQGPWRETERIARNDAAAWLNSHGLCHPFTHWLMYTS